MHEFYKKIIKETRIVLLFIFLFGIFNIAIGLIVFNSIYITIFGIIILMLSAFMYIISELQSRFIDAFEEFKMK